MLLTKVVEKTYIEAFLESVPTISIYNYDRTPITLITRGVLDYACAVLNSFGRIGIRFIDFDGYIT